MNPYKKEIIDMPKISDEEVKELVDKSKNGDKEARKKLVTSKMYLIVKVLEDYSKNKKYQALITESTYESLMSDCSLVLITTSTNYDSNNKRHLSFDNYVLTGLRSYLNRRFSEERKVLNNECHVPITYVYEDASDKVDSRILLETAIDMALNDIEKDIILSQYEVLNHNYNGVKELSEKYSLSHQRITQIRNKALDKIRKYLETEEKKEFLIKPLFKYLSNFSELEIIKAIQKLAATNKEYYDILMTTYKEGFYREITIFEYARKYMVEFKIVPELAKIIKSKDKESSPKNAKKAVTESFEFTDLIIANSAVFPQILEEFNDAFKQIIILKYKFYLSEEEIANKLCINLNEVNNVIINFLTAFKLKINEYFKENNEIIYRKDFISSKLFTRILCKMSIMEKYKQVIYLKFNGYSNDYIASTLEIDNLTLNNLLNAFMQLYRDQINFYIEDYIHLELKETNDILKR